MAGAEAEREAGGRDAVEVRGLWGGGCGGESARAGAVVVRGGGLELGARHANLLVGEGHEEEAPKGGAEEGPVDLLEATIWGGCRGRDSRGRRA